MKKYYLIIDLGIHSKTIETTKKEFEDWIDEISKEFEIIKHDIKIGTTVNIINHHEKIQLIGFILNEEEDNQK